jgi:dTDP-4-dehydrorhamnose reductase
MSPRVFVTGGSGLLGLNLVLQKMQSYDFSVLENSRKINLPSVEIVHMDLGSFASIEAELKSSSPDVVIHAAGMTNVDDCDAHPIKANFINGTLAGNLAKVTYELGIKFVHISTDHLFDGTDRFISEDTSPKPLNAYGFSKALGEEMVTKNNPDALIVRCNFFGWGPSYKPSFSDFIFNNLSKDKSIRLVDDVHYTPASTMNLIDSVHRLIEMDAVGIFNAVGSERISKYEFGSKVADIFGLPKNLIQRIGWDCLGAKAKRPVDMSLSDRKIRDFLGESLGTANQNIHLLRRQVDTQLFKRIKTI